ncbi:ATP-binding protein [Nocardioides caldifontis]|uniref:ATP-binding protein n=1 Tax=Nocardioides caldifontis TaxID=2588938 RepID=UPI0011DF4A1A|nr:ATP-binding protein [Nocardioides caldifontis]
MSGTQTTTGPRRAFRSPERGYLGGVAAGLADHLGVDALVVRVLFLLTSFVGFGVLFYAGLWLTLPMEGSTDAAGSSPGLDAATRQGKRPTRRRGVRDAGALVAVGCLVFGLAVVVDMVLGGGPFLVGPALLAAVGLMVLWRQADEAQRSRWLDASGGLDWRRMVVGEGGAAAWARLGTGLGLLVTALFIFAAQTGGLSTARDVVVAGVLGMVGLALTLGPWLVRLGTDLTEERAARVRQQERADVAAHLHDSVLQTLALIQKSAGDAGQVAKLARAQERDLREWLYGEPAAAETTLAAALRKAAAEVEDVHGVPVEVVTVGDGPVGEETVPLVAAAREAMANAVRHSGAAQVDVYVEVAGGRAEVFVRDRGKGFDLETVPLDRLGVRGSIIARMERHGGTAEVRSAPGQGTEVRVGMRLPGTGGD